MESVIAEPHGNSSNAFADLSYRFGPGVVGHRK